MAFLGCGRTEDDPLARLTKIRLEKAYFSDSFAATNVCADGETVAGIDVSKWQSRCPQGATVPSDCTEHPNWTLLATQATILGKPVDFAIMRAGFGTTKDATFDYNWPQSKAAGIIRGAYHYFHFSANLTAAAQAQAFLGWLGQVEVGDLPPTIDVEDDPGDLTPVQAAAKIQAFLDIVETATGAIPIIYTGNWWWTASNVQLGTFSRYPLWIAHYFKDPEPDPDPCPTTVGCPNTPNGEWDDWVIHQFSSSCHLSGITANSVDTNYFNGSLAALQALTIQGGPPSCPDGQCNGDENYITCPADCPAPHCGDGSCESGEDFYGCPADCPCEPVHADGRILDVSSEFSTYDKCISRFGNESYWHGLSDGYLGSLTYTEATDHQAPDNYMIYNLVFDEPGVYLLVAYLEGTSDSSTMVDYIVRHAGQDDIVNNVNHSQSTGWTELGEFNFAQGGNQYIRIDDNTGEALSSHKKILFDAIRLIPKVIESDGVNSDDGDANDGLTPDGDASSDGHSYADADADGGGDEAGDADGLSGAPWVGCSCTVSRSPFFSLFSLALIFVGIRLAKNRAKRRLR